MVQYKVVMVRHGESEWNEKNLFTGWYDANLNAKGITFSHLETTFTNISTISINLGEAEAKSAGVALKNAEYKFDKAYTSVLTRAQRTLASILKEINQEDIPIERTWRLNERHYGGLTGLNKSETAEKYGEAQVAVWRRSFDVPPPAMEEDHPYFHTIVDDPRYKDGPSKEEFPKFESLKLTIARTMPFWNDVIVPEIKAGKQILIAAHGNSLRGIVKTLDKMTEDQIMGLNLPTGIPFVYTLDENMEPVEGGSLQFLGDPETVKKAIEAVANQGKSK